jgi:hypothetical protein
MTAPARLRPILFSTPMVRALLDGRKTMMRTVLKPHPAFQGGIASGVLSTGMWAIYPEDLGGPGGAFGRTFAKGDLLWVKETWREGEQYVPESIFYFADAPWHEGAGWRPSIHMPRRFSRLTLRVTNVRVQRLQDISEDDAMAEGADLVLLPPDGGSSPCTEGFRALWTRINGPGSWESNPWVAAITFDVIRANVDAVANQPICEAV